MKEKKKEKVKEIGKGKSTERHLFREYRKHTLRDQRKKKTKGGRERCKALCIVGRERERERVEH